jgi:hypothetical protein
MIGKLKLYLILAAITGVLFVATNGLTAWKFYGMGRNECRAAWQKATLDAVGNKLERKVRQDAVRNAPIDDAVTVRRLRAGTF